MQWEILATVIVKKLKFTIQMAKKSLQNIMNAPKKASISSVTQILRFHMKNWILFVRSPLAHLPGMCAALFPMPVIGIPMKTSDLGGVDSLYSIVQMPSGIPVATVAINGGLNAGILAAKILATSDEKLLEKLEAYSEEMKQSVVEKAEKLDKVGYKNYE